MGNSILGRMDEMGKRMDELESNIGGRMSQAGWEPPNGAGATVMPLNARGTGSTKTSASAASSMPENKPRSISQRTSSSSSSVEI